MAFKIAGSMAFKKAYKQADPVLLEPIMEVDVTVPDDAVGSVNGDLNSRRGRLHGMEPAGGGMTMIKAEVPMAEMLTYSQSLTSMTGGRGDYHMPSRATRRCRRTWPRRSWPRRRRKGRGQGLRHRLTHRGAEKRGEREREVGLDPDDQAARWLAENDPPPEPKMPKSASKSKHVHRWRQRGRLLAAA